MKKPRVFSKISVAPSWALTSGAIYGTIQYVGKSSEKLWEQIEKRPHNVRFKDFCRLVEWFGFLEKGGRGSHRTFFHPGIREILDLQPMKGEAKPYQIKQFLKLVWQYQLTGGKK